MGTKPDDIPTGEAMRFELADIAPLEAARLWATPGIIEAMNDAIARAILAAKAEERQGTINEIDTLIESLNEGLMTDADLTQADRDAMTHQVMALHVAADAIRKRWEG